MAGLVTMCPMDHLACSIHRVMGEQGQASDTVTCWSTTYNYTVWYRRMTVTTIHETIPSPIDPKEHMLIIPQCSLNHIETNQC